MTRLESDLRGELINLRFWDSRRCADEGFPGEPGFARRLPGRLLRQARVYQVAHFFMGEELFECVSV